MHTKPTIGRVVLYWPTEHDNGNNNVNGNEIEGAQPMAATVSYVWGDNMVNLSIADHNGNSFGKTSVTMVDEEDMPASGQCEWMPYQKEQALKNDD